MFNPFRRNKSRSSLRPPRGPGETIRPEDAQDLQQWAAGRMYVEAFVEPETVVNEMSVVVVDENGEFIRRRIGGPKGIDAVAALLSCDIYDVEETGYPQRMRDWSARRRAERSHMKVLRNGHGSNDARAKAATGLASFLLNSCR